MYIDKLMKILPEKADAALIITEINRFYFTGFDSSDGYLLITRDKSKFYTDSRYIEKAQSVIKDCEVEEQKTDINLKMAEFLHSENVKTVAVEAAGITVLQLSNLKKAAGMRDFEYISDGCLDVAVNTLRSVKNKTEIQKIISAQEIAEKALDKLLGEIKPGMTEKEAQLKLDYYMLSMGADALSFDTIMASGKNSSMPHAVPTDKKIEYGDFITIDYGAVKSGYHSDTTRTVAVGKVSDEQKKIYSTVLEAQKKALSIYAEGVTCKDADFAARKVIEDAGYGKYFGHSTGHGVGVEIHERPFVSPVSRETLRQGNVISCEPGIYLPGKFGVRIEDIAVITSNGCENLVKLDKELIEL